MLRSAQKELGVINIKYLNGDSFLHTEVLLLLYVFFVSASLKGESVSKAK